MACPLFVTCSFWWGLFLLALVRTFHCSWTTWSTWDFQIPSSGWEPLDMPLKSAFFFDNGGLITLLQVFDVPVLPLTRTQYGWNWLLSFVLADLVGCKREISGQSCSILTPHMLWLIQSWCCLFYNHIVTLSQVFRCCVCHARFSGALRRVSCESILVCQVF